jgi:hypothetical protein
MKRLMTVAALACIATHAGAAPWGFDAVIDPITDAKRGIASLNGPQGSIVIKCDENGPRSIYVEIISRQYLGKSQYPKREVISHIDRGATESHWWRHDAESIVIADNREATINALELSSAKTIAYRATTYAGQIVDLTFEADGNDEAVRKAFSTCGQAWPGGPPMDKSVLSSSAPQSAIDLAKAGQCREAKNKAGGDNDAASLLKVYEICGPK